MVAIQCIHCNIKLILSIMQIAIAIQGKINLILDRN